MADRDKVIKALETCRKTDCANCEYSTEVCLIDEMISDAIALLKEQEDLGTELTNAVELIHKKNERIKKLLKEHETVVLCKDCKYWEHTPQNTTSYWKPCDEIKTEPHYFCWCGKRRTD